MALRRRRRRRRFEGVELNLAAMLDMAFQLLMFFILTFSPTPLESQVAMLLPGSGPIARLKPLNEESVNVDSSPPTPREQPLTVTVLSTPSGTVQAMAVGDVIVPDLAALNTGLRTAIDQAGGACSQLFLQFDGRLNYQSLLQIVEACTQGAVASPAEKRRITFVELRDKSKAH
jgi:biopolymer transport protein ExbD